MSEDNPPKVSLSHLSRGSSRRNSLSMPQGLDLLAKIAEYTWQTKPQVNSSFDDLVESGIRVPDACPSPIPPSRRMGQIAGPSRSGLHNRPQERYERVQQSHSESEASEMSDFSEVDSPTEVTASTTRFSGVKKPKRVGISMNPKGKGKHNLEDDDDTVPKLKPLATRRKSGIIPLRISDSNFLQSDPSDDDDDDLAKEVTSPIRTPSSSSLSSLLREKLNSMPIPGLFRKKKPLEYKLQVFVAILFLTIILLVGSIYVIHQEKEIQKSYYDRIRFSNKDRRILITNVKGREVLRGVLGTNLSKRDKPWPCLVQDQKINETCLEWMNKARLYFRIKQNPDLPAAADSLSTTNSSSLRCYEIFWQSIHPSFELKDCFDLGEKWGGHFYGGGELPGSNHWPLNKTSVPYSPFLTGNKIGSKKSSEFQWGRTLRRFFVNSEGAAIHITEDIPLHVSINEQNDRKLCIGAKVGSYGFLFEKGEHGKLNYTICTGDNVRETSGLLAQKDIWDGLKHEDLQVTRSLTQSPIWRILPQIIDHGNGSEAALLNHTDRIAALHISEGFILIDESWQKRIGDLEMDNLRFPTMAQTFNLTRRRGFKVALTIQPFFSTQSANYEEGLGMRGVSKTNLGDDGIWLAEKHPGQQSNLNRGNKKVPALTQYKNWTSVAVLDATNRQAQFWLENKVTTVVEKYGIDALYIDLGTAYDLPQFYEFSKSLSSSDYVKDLFLKALRPIQNVRTIGVSSAVKLPKLPTFVSLSPTESSWAGLQSVIPNILTMGVAGYPFIIPGAIGGDYFPGFESGYRSRNSTTGQLRIPDRELYIRWLELVHFLPVVQYSFLPSDYDQKVVDIATLMYVTRKNKLYPYIKKAIDNALTTGLPIIRPLWMIDPTDSNCLKVSDEFSIGEDIIVAPVIHPYEQHRDIYLPKGIWRNELDGSPTKGEKWLHHYRVKENQIPYFTKMADATGPVLPQV